MSEATYAGFKDWPISPKKKFSRKKIEYKTKEERQADVKNIIKEEQYKMFIYYRGRNDSISGNQEYFGMGTIKDIYPDPETIGQTKPMWYCDVGNYIEFKQPVYFKRKDNSYLENNCNNHPNLFRNGVRRISEEEFEEIINSSKTETNIKKEYKFFDKKKINSLEHTPIEKREQKSKDRKGQYLFRKELLKLYKGSCAISGTNIIEIIEAAHIMAYINTESNNIQNGILLRRDIHRLFDLDLIAIDTDYNILVSSKLKDTPFYKYQGQKILLPKNEKNHPSKDVLRYKLDNFQN